MKATIPGPIFGEGDYKPYYLNQTKISYTSQRDIVVAVTLVDDLNFINYRLCLKDKY